MRMKVRVIDSVRAGLESPFAASCHRRWGSCRVYVCALVKHVGREDTFKISSLQKPNLSEPGQDSPFWTLERGGCIKSLKGPRASFKAELTSDEEHVMHSTSVGYRAITWAHVLPSTADSKQNNCRTRGKGSGDGKERKRIWIVIEANQRNHFLPKIPTGVWKLVLLWIKDNVMQTSRRAFQKRNFRMSRFNLLKN